MRETYGPDSELMARVKIACREAVSPEMFEDMRIAEQEGGDGAMRDFVYINAVKYLWYWVQDCRSKATYCVPLTRWEHLKRALLPRRFRTWHPLDNGQPIFERVFLSPGVPMPETPGDEH